jgi:hypothetical protein
MSPLDSCSITKTESPTTATNPFQTLLTTISGLGSVSFAPGPALTGAGGMGGFKAMSVAQLSANIQQFGEREAEIEVAYKAQQTTEKQHAAAVPPIENDPIYTNFQDLYKVFRTGSATVIGSHAAYADIAGDRSIADNASWALLSYLTMDYRGPKWKQFNPECLPTTEDGSKVCADDGMKQVTQALKITTKPAIDVATVQGNLDILTGWQGLLHKNYEMAGETSATIEDLEGIDREVDTAKAIGALLNANLTALQTAQTALRASYLAAGKLQDSLYQLQGQRKNNQPFEPNTGYRDYVVDKNITPTIFIDAAGDLFETIAIAPDRNNTLTGALSCVSTVDMKTPTADSINYSILYQDLPLLSLSTGVLLTFQQKEVIGTTYVPSTDPSGNPIAVAEFGVTASGRVQVFPMAFVNVRAGSYRWYHTIDWGRTREERLIVSGAITGGIGVNSNSGTNQPEFFGGPTLMFNKVLISPGVHIGRVERLGNGFTIGETEPTGFSGNPPLNWEYRPAFSLGISFRVAPW